MTSSTQQNITTSLEQLDPIVVSDFMTLYKEGLTLDDSERENHLEAVAELVGDLGLYEMLVAKANEDMAVAKEVATEIRQRRGREAAVEIKQNDYAKLAPSFYDQVTDETRQNTFTYIDSDEKIYPEPKDIKQLTEAEGLQQLYGFLADFYNDTRSEVGVDRLTALSARSRSMLENLSFVGDKEFQEASYGIAAYWKNYLEENPDNQICALASVSHSSRYKDMRKSDDYFRDRILQTFTEEELDKYSGRIVGDINDVAAEPDKAKIVLIDDWSISGRELRTVHDELLKQQPAYYDFALAGAIEINLLASSKGRLEDGFKLNPSYDKDLPTKLPVKAYYQSRHSSDSQYEHHGHVTGTHSSVNYDFDKDVSCFPRALDRLTHVHREASRIALANIIPPYRKTEPRIEITADRLSKVD